LALHISISDKHPVSKNEQVVDQKRCREETALIATLYFQYQRLGSIINRSSAGQICKELILALFFDYKTITATNKNRVTEDQQFFS